METCLVVCPNMSHLGTLRHIHSTRPIVVASDDPRVQESARDMIGVVDVTFIDRKEPFWAIAPDVIAITEKVESWLASLAPMLPPELMTMMPVEGGQLGGRVQNILLLIRSYQHLFRAFDVREVYAIVDPDEEWETDVLAACASAQSCLVKILQ